MTYRMVTRLIGATLLAGCWGTIAQEVPGRIERVETGLSLRQVIRDRPQTMALRDRMAFYGVPAVVVTVVDSGRIVWTRGYGVLEAGTDRRVDSTTLFQVGSISKPVTALGALTLVEHGVLALDADVSRYLTSWAIPENAFVREHPVTLRALLSHRGGTTVSGFPGYARDQESPRLADVLRGSPPANTPPIVVDTVPGSRPRYSGGGFVVVQAIIQDVLGMPFERAMDSLVLRPLGMTASTFEQPLPGRLQRHAASGHDHDGSPVAGKWHVYPEMAAAGLWSTASDLARLVVAIQAVLAGKATVPLQAETAREMLHELSGAQGLGFAVGGEDSTAFFRHDGATRGFQASLFGFQHRGQGAVITTNAEQGLSLAYEILRSIAVEYDWPVLTPRVRDVAAVDASSLRRVAGRYRAASGDDQTLTIRLDGDTLRIGSTYWTGERVLYAASDSHYFTLEGDWELHLKLPADTGVVPGLRFGPVEFVRGTR